MDELFANSGGPDQTSRSAASDLGLHCLLVTRLGVSSFQWVKRISLCKTHPGLLHPRLVPFSSDEIFLFL